MVNREIDLIDLIYSILRRWRLLVILVIIGGVLAGIASYVITSRSAKDAENHMRICVDKMEAESEDGKFSLQEVMLAYELNESVINEIRSRVGLEKRYLKQNDYINYSRYMCLNANEIIKQHLVYTVSADSGEAEAQAVELYKTILASGASADYVSKTKGVDTTTVYDLCRVDDEFDSGMSGSNYFSIMVFSDDEAECEELVQGVDEYIRTELADKVHDVIPHSLEKDGVFVYRGYDRELSVSQMEYRATNLEFLSEINKYKSALSVSERAYYSFLALSDGTKNNTRDDVVYPSPEIKKNYVLLGMIAFPLAYMVLMVLHCIMDRRIRRTDDLEKLYGVNVLGNVNLDRKKRWRLFGFIDTVVEMLFRNDSYRFDQEKSLSFVVSAVRAAAGATEENEVCLVGCHFQDGIAEAMKEGLEKSGLQVDMIDNLIYDAGAMDRLKDSKPVVVIEKVGSTFHKEISKEVNLIQQNGVKLLGAVTIVE